jgi:hypothetical protein
MAADFEAACQATAAEHVRLSTTAENPATPTAVTPGQGRFPFTGNRP